MTSSARMNGHLFLWAITSALAGFLFGFDTVVISGAEQTIQTLWHLSAGVHGIAMAAALYGTVVGSVIGGWPADRFGRRPTLRWIGILYFVSAVWSGLAQDVYSFIVARFVRRARHRDLDRRCAAVYRGDRARRAAGTSRRHVPVQHCLRHPGRVPLQRLARRHRRQRVALDAGRRGVSRASVHGSLLHHPGEPPVADWQEAGPGLGPG